MSRLLHTRPRHLAAPTAQRAATCRAESLSIHQVDATQMDRGLYQGGLQAFEHGPCEVGIRDIDVAVVLAPDTGVRLWYPDEVWYLDLYDHPADLQRIGLLSAGAQKLATRIRRGQRVAIFCRQGRNRSGLLTALVLMQLHPDWSGHRVRLWIQQRRPGALTNEAFAEFLDRCASTVRPSRR